MVLGKEFVYVLGYDINPLWYNFYAIYITCPDDNFSLSVAIFCNFTVVRGYGLYLFLVLCVLDVTFAKASPSGKAYNIFIIAFDAYNLLFVFFFSQLNGIPVF